MSPAARIAAAIEILNDIDLRRRPAAESLRDWGRFNRYAGSRDRAAIAAHVYDALRVKSSSCWIMGSQTPRANMIGALREVREFSLDRMTHLFNAENHAPNPLTEDERQRYVEADLKDAPLDVAADFPTWLAPRLQRSLAENALEEGRALARRAPLDIRVNPLKTSREKALGDLAHFSPFATPISPVGLRIQLAEDGRAPPLTSDPVFLKGCIEVQDEGSQIAALATGAKEGEQVLDLCAGAGGKTLALAAMMNNRGQIYVTDKDARRLVPMYERLERAGVRNVQFRTPRGENQMLEDLAGRCDLVVVDAPCTGTGAWRRNPDAKWRVRPGALEQRMKDQDETLDRAALYVKPGGRIAYITCSLLCEENEDRIAAFLGRHAGFTSMDMRGVGRECGLGDFPARDGEGGLGLLLTPATTGTDGFFIGSLRRQG